MEYVVFPFRFASVIGIIDDKENRRCEASQTIAFTYASRLVSAAHGQNDIRNIGEHRCGLGHFPDRLSHGLDSELCFAAAWTPNQCDGSAFFLVGQCHDFIQLLAPLSLSA